MKQSRSFSILECHKKVPPIILDTNNREDVRVLIRLTFAIVPLRFSHYSNLGILALNTWKQFLFIDKFIFEYFALFLKILENSAELNEMCLSGFPSLLHLLNSTAFVKERKLYFKKTICQILRSFVTIRAKKIFIWQKPFSYIFIPQTGKPSALGQKYRSIKANYAEKKFHYEKKTILKKFERA